MRLFLDANVLFSAVLRPEDREYAFFRLARQGRCRICSSVYAREEAERNLTRKAPALLRRFHEIMPLVELTAEPDEAHILWALAQGLPAKDAPILAAAVLARADRLVTGDRRHFGALFGRSLRGVRVTSLADGLAEVLAAAEGRR